MSSAQFITVRETSQILGVTEKKVLDLVEEGKLQAYKIAGQFLRLKRSEVMTVRNAGQVVNEAVQFRYTFGERVRDFFYYNDFYLLSVLFILVLLYVIFNL